MPRIRKKTSNRQSTNDRRKIQRKVRESRKKSKKAGKNEVQWKSKKPKDPGIPNNFPFKDQILAEVSETRRLEAEEKQRKKDEKKALRAKAKNPDAQDDAAEDTEEVADAPGVELDELKGLQVGNDAVGAVGARTLVNAKTFSKLSAAPTEDEEDEEEEAPFLVNRDLPNLQAVLDAADVVVEVLDARDPLSFRSSDLEELITGKQILLVLNKIDACPRESISAWAKRLRKRYPTALFRSATAFLPSRPSSGQPTKGKGKAKAPTHDALGVDSVLNYLGEWAKAKAGDEPLAVAVLGVTNSGKSSFVNSLLRKTMLPVYTLESSSRGPTTTEFPQEVTLEVENRTIRLIDTPGLSWKKGAEEPAEDDSENARVRDILLRAKGRIDRLKDPTPAVENIVSRSSAEDLMLLYNIPAFSKDDPNSFLAGVARANQLVKKRGELDLLGASRILLRDWSTGKFARYTMPPNSSAPSSTPSDGAALNALDSADAAILETLTPRKEMRKTTGIVKLVSGIMEPRKTALDEPWWKEGEEESDQDDEGDFEEFGGLGGSSDEDEESGDDEDDEEEDDEDEEIEDQSPPPPPPSKKQKRKLVDETPAARPAKKVAFAPHPKESKQSRKLGSLNGQKPKPLVAVINSTKNPKGPALERKVANAPAKRKTAPDGKANEDAYDFRKFF